MENNKYVYIYLDPRKPGVYKYEEFKFDYELIYVGYGSGNRSRDHLYGKQKTINSWLKGKIRSIKSKLNREPIILKVKEGLGKKEGLELEIRLIKLIGRLSTKTGTLTNFTDGGENSKHNKGRKWTKEQRKKLEKIRQDNPPRLGQKNSDYQKQIVRDLFKDKEKTEQHKKNLSIAASSKERNEKRNKKIEIILENTPSKLRVYDLSGNIIGEYRNILHAHKNLCFEDEKAYREIKLKDKFRVGKYIFEKITN